MATSATTMELRNALRARDRVAINDAAARLLEQRTPLGDQWFSVAHVLVRNGEVAQALAVAERGVEECGCSAKAQFERAQVLASVGRPDEGAALVSALPAGQLNPVESEHFLGTCAMELGDFDAARSAFSRVVAAWGGSGPSWLSLAALPASDDAELLDRMNAATSAIGAAPADYRAQWHYAKGAVLDRLGRTDEAFAEFTAGAEIVRAARPYDPDADRLDAETLSGEFSRAAVEGISRQVTTGTSGPILVTGLPRSGTTLVEQILASHSAVAGGGEMPFGSILMREIGGTSLSRLEAFASAHGADALAQLYLHLGDEQFGAGKRFVDKCLGNSRALGILASVLPQARIVWLRRDPLDCAWSCFRTYFSHGMEWSWSLTDIAVHFAAEDMLYAPWREVLGDRLLTLSYEELAAYSGVQIGRILDHVGLAPEPAMEDAHRTRRPVLTASVAQVRQPVYQSAVGAADRYRAHLKGFTDAYRASSEASP